MTRYLLAAEADKIQDLIFKAIRLAEIIGGSHLLTSWCHEVKKVMLSEGIPEEDILIGDGGAFRVMLPDRKSCVQWGEWLAETYNQTLGGSLSVAEPVEVADNFRTASKEAQRKLRLAKRRSLTSAACLHNPYAAFCKVCGSGIAGRIEQSYEGERDIVCPYCSRRFKLSKDQSQNLAQLFIKKVESLLPAGIKLSIPDSTDGIGRFERGNVAYFVADGNKMGIVFDHCEAVQMKTLSEKLPEVLLESLAIETARLVEHIYQREIEKKSNGTITLDTPVLPLILGGDDVYVLLAAPYSLDFVRRFSEQYNQLMADELAELKLSFSPGICAGLVICKANYPHTLAHNLAHEFLREAKYCSRQTHSSANLSLISFGQALTEKNTSGDFLNTLQPYSLTNSEALGSILPLQKLIDARFTLRGVPGSRLESLLVLHDPTYLPERIKEDQKRRWRDIFKEQLLRAGRRSVDLSAIERVLAELGSLNPDKLYMREANHRKEQALGSALPDVIAYWDYFLDLDRCREEYGHGH